MQRALRLPLGVAAVLFAAACVDQPGSDRTPTGPTGPALTVTGTACDNNIYKAISDKQSVLFSGNVLKSIKAAAGDMSKACGTANSNNVTLNYVALVIANKATSAYVPNVPISTADQNRATAIADLIDNALVFGGLVTTSGIPFKSLLPGGAAKVCPQTANPNGECVVITEGYVVAGVVQKDLIAPTGSHLYLLFPTTCSPTNLHKEASYCIDLTTVPAASSFNPELQGFVCTSEQDHAPGAGDENNALVNVSHGLPNGNTEVLKKPAPGEASAALSTPCTHGTQPTYASAGLSGTFERFLARATNVVRPRMLYAINAGPPFSDAFGDGTSPLGAVNRAVFFDDFTDETVGAAPVSPVIGQNWVVLESGAGTVRVQASVGNALSKPVVLNQAQGCTTNCGQLELRGTLQEENGQVANFGRYSLTFDALQDRPTIISADFVLRGADNLVIATLRYATVGNANVLQYLTQTGFVNVGTWVVHEKQSFEIIVDLNAKTTTLNIGGGAAEATNVPFVQAATSWSVLAWENSNVDSGKTAWDNINAVRLVDP
jgi:hypothetical protein